MDPSRLGPYRRNRRDYSAHQRRAGKDCADRMDEQDCEQLVVLSMAAVLAMDSDSDDEGGSNSDGDGSSDEEDDLLMMATVGLARIAEIRKANLVIPDAIPHVDITFDSFTAQQYDNMFDFSREDCERMYNELGVPDKLYVNEGRHRSAVDGVKSFLYMLCRYFAAPERQVLDQNTWGYDYSMLSKMFDAMLDWMDTTHGAKLKCLQYISMARLQRFNDAITGTLATMFPNDALPPEAVNCALFADGSRIKVSFLLSSIL